jgi:hypothetical protein
MISNSCEASGEELNAGDHDPGLGAGDGCLEVLCETAVAAEPSEDGLAPAPFHGKHSREQMSPLSRRRLLRVLAATGAAAMFRPPLASSQQAPVLTKPIPSSGEALPAIGLGSWITFNVGDDPVARGACAQVMRAFFDAGGHLIDSSPM